MIEKGNNVRTKLEQINVLYFNLKWEKGTNVFLQTITSKHSYLKNRILHWKCIKKEEEANIK